MQRIAPFFDGNQPFQLRHAAKHAFGHPPTDNGEARIRMLPRQMIEQPGGQHRIANAG